MFRTTLARCFASPLFTVIALAIALMVVLPLPAAAQSFDELGMPIDHASVLEKGGCTGAINTEPGFSGSWYAPALPGVYLHVQVLDYSAYGFGMTVGAWLNTGWHPDSNRWATWGAGSTTQATQDTQVTLRQPYHPTGSASAGFATRTLGTARLRWFADPRIELLQIIPPLSPRAVVFYPQRLSGKPPACPDHTGVIDWIRGG